MKRNRASDLNLLSNKPGYEKTSFYLVKEDILPEAIKKTIKVKEILKRGEVRTINEAVARMAKIRLSRCLYCWNIKQAFSPVY